MNMQERTLETNSNLVKAAIGRALLLASAPGVLLPVSAAVGSERSQHTSLAQAQRLNFLAPFSQHPDRLVSRCLLEI